MLRFIDVTLPAPRDNIALDAALFREVEATGRGETLRVWESAQPAVIVPRWGAIRAEVEVNEEACRADGVPIVQRISGGGAVVVGRGCLNYALVLSLDAHPALRNVARSYRLILDCVVRALAVPGLSFRDPGDLALDDRKVSGSAQRRGRRALLHHGTLLYDFEIPLMKRYLKEPVRQPAYRARRCHAAFVANVPLSAETATTRLVAAFGAVALQELG